MQMDFNMKVKSNQAQAQSTVMVDSPSPMDRTTKASGQTVKPKEKERSK